MLGLQSEHVFRWALHDIARIPRPFILARIPCVFRLGCIRTVTIQHQELLAALLNSLRYGKRNRVSTIQSILDITAAYNFAKSISISSVL